MRSTISTWEDAISAIIFKKPLFARSHLPATPRGAFPQPTTAPNDIEVATRAKSEEHYIMLVESDVRSSVHGILP